MWPVLQGLGLAMVYAIQRATPALLKTKKAAHALEIRPLSTNASESAWRRPAEILM